MLLTRLPVICENLLHCWNIFCLLDYLTLWLMSYWVRSMNIIVHSITTLNSTLNILVPILQSQCRCLTECLFNLSSHWLYWQQKIEKFSRYVWTCENSMHFLLNFSTLLLHEVSWYMHLKNLGEGLNAKWEMVQQLYAILICFKLLHWI
jgi:hypothetical protein